VPVLLLFFLLPVFSMNDADFTTTELYGQYVNVKVDLSWGALLGFGFAWFPDLGCGNFYVGGVGNSNLFNDTLLFPNYCNPSHLKRSPVVQNLCETFSLNTTVTTSTVRLLYDCRLSNGTNDYAFNASFQGSAVPIFTLPKHYTSLSIVTSSSECPPFGPLPSFQTPPNSTTTVSITAVSSILTSGRTYDFAFYQAGGYGGPTGYDYCLTFNGSYSQTLSSSFISWGQPLT
jgi:hypothetical protein